MTFSISLAISKEFKTIFKVWPLFFKVFGCRLMVYCGDSASVELFCHWFVSNCSELIIVSGVVFKLMVYCGDSASVGLFSLVCK